MLNVRVCELAGLCILGFLRVACAEALLTENFDNLDLNKLPQGWSATAPDVSFSDEPGHGKVLRISGKGNEPGLTINLDTAKAIGRTLRCEAMAKTSAFTPNWEKHGCPQLMIQYAVQGSLMGRYCPVQPNADAWQKIGVSFAIPPEATSVRLVLRVNTVTADVCFDDLTLHADGVAVAAVPQPGGQPPAASASPPAAAAAPAIKPEGKAAEAPTKLIDNDGFSFNPMLAAYAQKGRNPAMAANSLLLAGPGLPLKELDLKLLKGKSLVAAKELVGVLPERLMVLLPDILVKNKPEVVILAGDAALTRNLAPNERFDWEDVARICTRFGAVPILAVPGGEKQAELRRAMLAAADAAQCPAIDIGSTNGRLAQLLGILEVHVFERVKARAAEIEEE